MDLGKVLIVYKGKDNTDSLDTVRAVLKRNSIRFYAIERDKLRQKNKPRQAARPDLVVVVGGDGTFLRASHHIGSEVPVLGVNSSPKTSEGFFMRYTKDNFSGAVKRLLENKAKILRLTRLKAEIDNRPVKFMALNDFYAGCREAYKTARYTLKINGRAEWQRSSGVIVATAAGTTAWLGSAGGKRLSLNSNMFSFVVREPYMGRIVRPKLIKGVLNENQSLTIISDMYTGVLVVDSIVEIPLKQKSQIKIVVGKPLNFVL